MGQSRNEDILENILGADNVLMPPESRIEYLLQEILKNGSIGGGGIVDADVDENGNLVVTLSNGTEKVAGHVVGETGPQGPQGVTGATGATGSPGAAGSPGPQGIQGPQGEPFMISATYPSIAAMEADFSNPDVANGAFVMIASDASDPDNAKVYVKGTTAFSFVVDLSGAQGIQGMQGIQGIQGPPGQAGAAGSPGVQGPQGIQGIPGPTGETGNGIYSTTFADGSLTINYTDGTHSDAFDIVSAVLSEMVAAEGVSF